MQQNEQFGDSSDRMPEQKRRTLTAVLLGLLVIPAGVVFIPLFLFVRWVLPFGIRDVLVGLPLAFFQAGIALSTFIAAVLFIVKFAIPVIISWRVTHSRKLAVITLISALAVQIVVSSVAVQQKKDVVRQKFFQELQSEERFKQSVSVGVATYQLSDPLPENPYPQYGQMYQGLSLTIPLTVAREGDYFFRVRYSNMRDSGLSVVQEREERLGEGLQTMTVVMRTQDSIHPLYWFKGPRSRSTVSVTVFERTTEKAIYGRGSTETREWEIGGETFTFDDLASLEPLRGQAE